MSMYNMMNGVNQVGVFLILPMLDKHPDEYPRFRDCFLGDDNFPRYDNHIHIYTRVGGGNKGQGYGEERLRQHPNYIADLDDSFDSTYCSYIFSVPEKWKEDYDKIVNNDFENVSKEYQEQIFKVYPELEERLKPVFL